jgi:hypothetical protein
MRSFDYFEEWLGIEPGRPMTRRLKAAFDTDIGYPLIKKHGETDRTSLSLTLVKSLQDGGDVGRRAS